MPKPAKNTTIPLSALPTVDQIQTELSRRHCQRSLAEFVAQGWHVLEPQTELLWGWAPQTICDHLEAVTDERIKRLLINCPPGLMKSLLVSVFWPAWEWGPRGLSHHSFVSTSYAQDLALRDSRKMRMLVESDWFQKRWPLKFASDANAKGLFENEKRGFRSSTAFTSMTGKRGHRVILDDPHSVRSGESDAQRQETITTFREALPSRVNNKDSAIVVVMQRLHEEDVSGEIISRNDGRYVHLCLPMRFEVDRACETRIGFKDPRTKEGELLFPEFFDEERTSLLEAELASSYAIAGQLQQRPVAREGGLFKRHWFDGKIVDAAPRDAITVRHWDLAATAKKTAARTAGVKMSRDKQGRFYIEHCLAFQEDGHVVRQRILATADADGQSVEVNVPQDPGAAGKVAKMDYAALLAGFKFHCEPETGDKVQRAEPFSAQVEAGNVYLVRGQWNNEYLDELCLFPGSKWKDRVDASSAAFGRLLKLTNRSKSVIGFGPKLLSA